MNIKDLKFLKKQFKQENSLLRINDVYSVYINGDNREILTTEFTYFHMLEEEVQNLLLKNMKKILTGNIDIKIFEKEFNEEMLDDADGSSKVLKNMLQGKKDDFIDHCNTMIKKLLTAYTYDKSVAVYFTRVTLQKKDADFTFVICTINKAEVPKQQFVYNFDNKAFEYQAHTEPVIKMTAPLEGFCYPVYENEFVSFDKVLYYSSKSNKVNANFIFNVLNCDIKLTAKQEKTYFHDILNTMMDGKIKPVQLYSLYDNILRRFELEEDEEYRTVTPSVLSSVLDEINIQPVAEVKEAYTKVLGNANYQFKVSNILPDLQKKSINIGNDDTEINIKPDYLENIHQVQTDNGDMYLLVRLNENLSANGFNIDVEPIEELLKQ